MLERSAHGDPGRDMKNLTTSILVGMALMAAIACSGPPGSRAGAPSQTARLIPTDAEGILEAVRQSGARVVMVNVWATFCQPCREEFPDMMRLNTNYQDQGFRLMLVSADFPDQTEQAKAFLRKQGVTFDTYIKEGKDSGFIDGLDERWSGAIPATWIYSADGEPVAFWEGKATYEQFEAALLKALQEG